MTVDKSIRGSLETVERQAMFSKKYKTIEFFFCRNCTTVKHCDHIESAKRTVFHCGDSDCIHNIVYV